MSFRRKKLNKPPDLEPVLDDDADVDAGDEAEILSGRALKFRFVESVTLLPPCSISRNDGALADTCAGGGKAPSEGDFLTALD